MNGHPPQKMVVPTSKWTMKTTKQTEQVTANTPGSITSHTNQSSAKGHKSAASAGMQWWLKSYGQIPAVLVWWAVYFSSIHGQKNLRIQGTTIELYNVLQTGSKIHYPGESWPTSSLSLRPRWLLRWWFNQCEFSLDAGPIKSIHQ